MISPPPVVVQSDHSRSIGLMTSLLPPVYTTSGSIGFYWAVGGGGEQKPPFTPIQSCGSVSSADKPELEKNKNK